MPRSLCPPQEKERKREEGERETTTKRVKRLYSVRAELPSLTDVGDRAFPNATAPTRGIYLCPPPPPPPPASPEKRERGGDTEREREREREKRERENSPLLF